STWARKAARAAAAWSRAEPPRTSPRAKRASPATICARSWRRDPSLRPRRTRHRATALDSGPSRHRESRMAVAIDYFFSPQSPWTYLGHERFAEIARDAGATI